MTKKFLFAVYFLAVFLESGAYGLTFLLPPLFAEFGANAKDVGAVLMVTAISTLMTILALGHISAKFGRMNTIVLASLLISLSLYLLAEAESYSLILFFAGSLLGIGWGLFYVLTPVVLTEITTKEQRISIFTLLSVFIMAGFGLSPVFGSIFIEAGFSIQTTFHMTAGLCLFSAVLFLLLRPSVARYSHDPKASDHSALNWTAILSITRSGALYPIIMGCFGGSVFAAVTNFQTIYAEQNGLDYATYFLSYTCTVIVCRVVFAQFLGGKSPYATIALLLAVMTVSILILLVLNSHILWYILGAILFGLGYGVSYPIIKAMAANDAEPEYLSQTLQLFGLSYFIGIFGFPFIAGWIITSNGITVLLGVAVILACLECGLAAWRHFIR